MRDRLLKRALQLAIAAVLLANSIFYYPFLRIAIASLRGRNACSARETIEGLSYIKRCVRSRENLTQASRFISQDAHGLHLWQTPAGRFWLPARSEGYLPLELAEQQNNLYGEGEWGVHAGDIVLDCGANLGAFTRRALSAGARLVIAIEPAPDNVECLRRTFATEVAGGSVVVYPKGVWNKDDVLVLHNGGSSLDDSFVLQSGANTGDPRLPLTTIDKLVAELKLARVDFVKMDIEGAERQALAGARQTITAYKPRLAIATEHLWDDPERIPALVRSLRPGYRTRCGPCYGMPTGRIQPDVEYFY